MSSDRQDVLIFTMSGSELDDNYIPTELIESAQIATNSTLPAKSKHIYDKCYNNFCAWQKQKKTKSFDEIVLLAYFRELSKTFNSASLWSKYAMLKSKILVEKSINIKRYSKLQSFIKVQHTGYQPKKAKVFSSSELNEFLKTAPDSEFLAAKVGLIFGIIGACRRDELHKLTEDDVRVQNSLCIVSLQKTKNHSTRQFTIEGHYLNYVTMYINLRPKKTDSNKFFLGYHKSRCINQAMGIHKIGSMPQTAAKFLNLPDSNLYTGHSFRRTSATLLADLGTDMTTLKRHGGWKSSAVAEGYIEDSVNNKRKISRKIMNAVNESSSDTYGADDNDSVIPSEKRKQEITINDAIASCSSGQNQNTVSFTLNFKK